MAELPPLWVEYPASETGAGPVIVERVSSADVDDEFTKGVIMVTRDAYTAQFGDTRVPSSVIAEVMNPDDDRVIVERRDLIAQRIQTGNTQYWVARGEQLGKIDGLSKVMTNGSAVYLGDVMVAPPWRRGLGSRLLHAPFKFGGYDEGSSVEMDAFEGSSVNAWYVQLGFRPNEFFDLTDTFDIGAYSLATRRIAIPRRVGLGGLVRVMEQGRPVLAGATVHTSRPQWTN